jgi:hypothetical protein
LDAIIEIVIALIDLPPHSAQLLGAVNGGTAGAE